MCISRKLKFLFEPERDYPRCISQNPSEIIIGVQIHDVLSVVFSTFLRGYFTIHQTRFTTPSLALCYIRRTLFLYVIKRAFTTSSYALYFHTSPFIFLRDHEAIFNSLRTIYLREHFFIIHMRAIFLRKSHALF